MVRLMRPLPTTAQLPYQREQPIGAIAVELQPIVDVTTGTIVAAEALARFPTRQGLPVDVVFNGAYVSGWGPELEAACLQVALDKRAEIPSNVVLTVNLSPDALSHPGVRRILRSDLSGVAIEITEQAARDVDALHEALADIRRRGGLIAIDDASTGYAGLSRLSGLRPDLVKIDRGVVSGARGNDAQIVVIEALVSLSHRIGARVLGEGVETADDLTVLAELSVDYAQGWAIGRPAARLPATLPEAIRVCRAARKALMAAETLATSEVTGTRSITAALAGSVKPADLSDALASASASLGVDVIGLSILSEDGTLHEITAAGAETDHGAYTVTDYPATRTALATGTMAEAHVNDPDTDQAEREILLRDGFASVLVTPVIGAGKALGVLEFSNRVHRRWTNPDMMQARVVAEHVASALVRMLEPQDRAHRGRLSEHGAGAR
jgi:EAL domain-containing protein (putative c-di-GMP-specific phosphodiesterase class I)